MLRNPWNCYSDYKLDLSPLSQSINNTPFKPRIVCNSVLLNYKSWPNFYNLSTVGAKSLICTPVLYIGRISPDIFQDPINTCSEESQWTALYVHLGNTFSQKYSHITSTKILHNVLVVPLPEEKKNKKNPYTHSVACIGRKELNCSWWVTITDLLIDVMDLSATIFP